MEAILVSIPFIAGQWSLRGWLFHPIASHLEFQSPSLRGSGRFERRQRCSRSHCRKVSIPFIAGQWSLLEADAESLLKRLRHVSIPFIAGQWSLRPPMRRRATSFASFNPLHCGAVVASARAGAREARDSRVSIPFIAGQWSLRRARRMAGVAGGKVSIPFIAGQWSLPVVARVDEPTLVKFQSPSLRGSGRFL